MVFERRFDFVLKRIAIYGNAVFGRPCRRRASLDHEVGDAPMERRLVIGTASTQSEEIIRRLGTCFAEELELETAVRGVKSDRHDR